MTLPSKYRSPRSRDFRQYYFYYILVGGFAITIYLGFLRSVEKYGSGFLSGWTIKNILVLVGFSAMFVLTLLFSRMIFRKIIGRPWWEMSITEYLVYRYRSIVVASVIFAVGLLFVGFLDYFWK